METIKSLSAILFKMLHIPSICDVPVVDTAALIDVDRIL